MLQTFVDEPCLDYLNQSYLRFYINESVDLEPLKYGKMQDYKKVRF